jgi:hypothetical protein
MTDFGWYCLMIMVVGVAWAAAFASKWRNR